MNITSITISRTQIAAVIQDWLNAHVLREPAQVTSIEVDTDIVTVALDGPPSAPPVTVSPCHPVTPPPAPEPQEAPAPGTAAPKSARKMPRRKLTDDEHATVRLQAQRGQSVAQIARNLGVAQSSVQKILDEPAQ